MQKLQIYNKILRTKQLIISERRKWKEKRKTKTINTMCTNSTIQHRLYIQTQKSQKMQFTKKKKEKSKPNSPLRTCHHISPCRRKRPRNHTSRGRLRGTCLCTPGNIPLKNWTWNRYPTSQLFPKAPNSRFLDSTHSPPPPPLRLPKPPLSPTTTNTAMPTIRSWIGRSERDPYIPENRREDPSRKGSDTPIAHFRIRLVFYPFAERDREEKSPTKLFILFFFFFVEIFIWEIEMHLMEGLTKDLCLEFDVNLTREISCAKLKEREWKILPERLK